MKIEYLRSFYYIVKCKSISKASKTLHITQPGLSKQLQKLEDNFSAPLLKRSNKGVKLTEVGKKVFDFAETILHLEENLYSEVKRIKNKNEQLVIAACQNFGSFYFASKIHKFEKNYEDIRVKIDTFNSSEVLNKILNNDYDLGILVERENFDNPFLESDCEDCPYITKEDFFKDRLVLCASKNYDKNKIARKELKNIPLIMREKTSSAYFLLENFFSKIGYKMEDLNISLNSNSINITKQSVINGSTLGFIPRSAINVELKRNVLKIVEIESEHSDMLDFEYSLVKRKNYKLNKYEKLFNDFILSL